MELKWLAPPQGALMPGIVTPYRETQLSFEVSDPVMELLNVGDEVEGEQIRRDGTSIAQGDMVARIDSGPFERAVTKAQRRLESAQTELEALSIQLDQVLPARVESAQHRAEAAEPEPYSFEPARSPPRAELQW